jgi:hypothetical protein
MAHAQPVFDEATKRRAVEVFAALRYAGIGGDEGMTDEVRAAFQLYVLDGIGSPHAVVAAACRPRGQR